MHDKVISVVAFTKYCASHDVSRELRLSFVATGKYLRELVESGQIIIIGKAYQVRKDIRRDANIYGLPGTPKIVQVKAKPGARPGAPRMQREHVRSPLNKAGSGVIAPPPYKTGYRWGKI